MESKSLKFKSEKPNAVFALFAVGVMVAVGVSTFGMDALGHLGVAPQSELRSVAGAVARQHAHATPLQFAQFATHLRGMTQSQILAATTPLGIAVDPAMVGSPASSAAPAVHGRSAIDCSNIFSCVGGFAGGFGTSYGGSGATIVATGILTGFGCVAAGLAGCITGYLLARYLQANAGIYGLLNEDQYVELALTTFNNAMGSATAYLKNGLSTLNTTQFAWDNIFDSQAENQLGSSVFNYPLAFAQSGVGVQFSSFPLPWIAMNSQQMQVLDYDMYALSGQPNLHDSIASVGGACMGICASTDTWYGGFGALESVGTSSSILVVIQHGAQFSYNCNAGGSGIIQTVLGTTMLNLTTSLQNITWPGPNQTLWFNATGAACGLNGLGILAMPVGPYSPNAATATVEYACGHKVTPGSCKGLGTNLVLANTPDYLYGSNSSSGVLPGVAHVDLFNSTFAYFSQQLNTMAKAAMINGAVYWSFLRSLGYTDRSQIPSNCKIPYPDMSVTPGTFENGFQNDYNTTYAAYIGWLNSLAVFFNAAPNTTSFCKGHPVFHLGVTPGPMAGENITGFLYTFPIGHQKWRNPYTWAVNGSNTPLIPAYWNNSGATNKTPISMVLWPNVYTVSIPLGRVVQIAVNNPLTAFVPQVLEQFDLYGNGSAQNNGSTLGTSIAPNSGVGTAIYLTTCVIASVAENPCTLVLTTLNQSIFNISCYPLCSPLPPPPSGGGCGVPSYLGFLTGFINSVNAWIAPIPFIGPLGCVMGWIFLFVFIAVIVGVALYVVGFFRKAEGED